METDLFSGIRYPPFQQVGPGELCRNIENSAIFFRFKCEGSLGLRLCIICIEKRSYAQERLLMVTSRFATKMFYCTLLLSQFTIKNMIFAHFSIWDIQEKQRECLSQILLNNEKLSQFT